jgi:putative inorganic carbon (HCO3(-)) transporter
VEAELARAGGVVGSAALAALLLARPRWLRLASLVAVGAGGAALGVYVAPSADAPFAAAAAVGGILIAIALATAFVRWPWLLVVAALACVPARVPIDVGGEEANLLLPLYAVVAGGALALAWRLLRGADRSRELGPLAWPLAAFVLWSGVSLTWVDRPREGAISLLAFYLPFGVLAVCVARLPWSRRWLTIVYGQLTLMALAFAAIGLYQWLTRDVFWNPRVIIGNAYAPFYRVNSIFWDPSIYGRFLVVAILASLVLAVHGTSRRAWAAAGAVAAAWVGLLLSFSQSSFGALIVGALAVAAFGWGVRRAVAVGVALAVVAVASLALPQVREEILGGGLDRATSGRAGLVSNGVRIAADHPAGGVGLGGFKRAYGERVGLRGEDPSRAASHNTPVTVVAETGIVGIALFAWLLTVAFGLPFRRASRSFAGRVSLIVGVALMAIAVHSLFYNAFFEDPMVWALFGLGAVAYAWRTGRKEAL